MKLFQHIWNQCKALRFMIPILTLSKCFFISHICTFCKVLSQTPSKQPKFWLKKFHHILLSDLNVIESFQCNLYGGMFHFPSTLLQVYFRIVVNARNTIVITELTI